MITYEGKVMLWYVRIRQGSCQSLAKTVYYRKEMTFEFMCRWKWYFHYREALVRIKTPRHFTELLIGSYEPDKLTATQIKAKRLRDRIISKKGKITEKKNLLRKALENWNSFLPIEEDPIWPKAVAKIESLKCELTAMESEYQALINPHQKGYPNPPPLNAA